MPYALPQRIISRTSVTFAYGEFVVRAYDQHGKRWPEADYFTFDRDDAYETAERMIDYQFLPKNK